METRGRKRKREIENEHVTSPLIYWKTKEEIRIDSNIATLIKRDVEK